MHGCVLQLLSIISCYCFFLFLNRSLVCWLSTGRSLSLTRINHLMVCDIVSRIMFIKLVDRNWQIPMFSIVSTCSVFRVHWHWPWHVERGGQHESRATIFFCVGFQFVQRSMACTELFLSDIFFGIHPPPNYENQNFGQRNNVMAALFGVCGMSPASHHVTSFSLANQEKTRKQKKRKESTEESAIVVGI